MKHFTLTIALFLCAFFTNQLHAQCNHQDDYTALRALYLSTGGDRWIDNTGWPDSVTFAANSIVPRDTDMSSWTGISCDGQSRVDQISLTNNNMVGTLPTEIGLLSEPIPI